MFWCSNLCFQAIIFVSSYPSSCVSKKGSYNVLLNTSIKLKVTNFSFLFFLFIALVEKYENALDVFPPQFHKFVPGPEVIKYFHAQLS